VAGRARIIDWVTDLFRKAIKRGRRTHVRTSPDDLFAFGGRVDDGFPRAPRPRDMGVDAPDGLVGPHGPPGSAMDEIPGASTFSSVEAGMEQGLSGQVFRLPAGTQLPDGLAVHADGADVGGLAPRGHRTVYPSEQMTFAEFQSRYSSTAAGWEHYGTVNKKGVFTPAGSGG
jgi:hypothetical protein